MKEVQGFEAQIGAERERQAAAMKERLAKLREARARHGQPPSESTQAWS